MTSPYSVREFEIKDMLPIAMTLIVAGIGIAFGLNVVGDQRDELGEEACLDKTDGYNYWNASIGSCMNVSGGGTQSPGTAEFNATNDAITGISKIPKKLPLIATVVIAAIVIGILVRYLMVRYA